MPAKNDDLHRMVPDRSPVALILIDVISRHAAGLPEDALAHMRRVLNVDTTPSPKLDLGQLILKQGTTEPVRPPGSPRGS